MGRGRAQHIGACSTPGNARSSRYTRNAGARPRCCSNTRNRHRQRKSARLCPLVHLRVRGLRPSRPFEFPQRARQCGRAAPAFGDDALSVRTGFGCWPDHGIVVGRVWEVMEPKSRESRLPSGDFRSAAPRATHSVPSAASSTENRLCDELNNSSRAICQVTCSWDRWGWLRWFEILYIRLPSLIDSTSPWGETQRILR